MKNFWDTITQFRAVWIGRVDGLKAGSVLEEPSNFILQLSKQWGEQRIISVLWGPEDWSAVRMVVLSSYIWNARWKSYADYEYKKLLTAGGTSDGKPKRKDFYGTVKRQIPKLVVKDGVLELIMDLTLSTLISDEWK